MKICLSFALMFAICVGCASPKKNHGDFLYVSQFVEMDPSQMEGTEVRVDGWVCVDGPSIDLRLESQCDDTHGIVLNLPRRLRSQRMESGRARIVGTFVDNNKGEMLLNYKRNRYLGNYVIEVDSISFYR